MQIFRSICNFPPPHSPCVVDNSHDPTTLRLLNLLPQDALQRDGVGGKLADALAELLDGHLVLVEVEAVQWLVLEVMFPGDVEGLGVGGVEFLGDVLGRVVEFFEEVGLCATRQCVSTKTLTGGDRSRKK